MTNYNKPALEELGHVHDLTEQNSTNDLNDFQLGQPNPGHLTGLSA